MKRVLSGIIRSFQPICNYFSQINLPKFAIVSFVLIGINFLPFITKLGFYLDDWPQVYSWNVRGLEGIQQYWIADSRWFTWWIQGLLFPILGTKPIFWHITMFLLRWITAILFWVILKKIWPKQTIQITAAALLFGIYPLFVQQSSAVMFTVIWVCFTLYLVSVLLMVHSYQSKKWFVPLTILGLVIDVINLFSYEYFLGVEFIRPVIFLLLINKENLTRGRKARSIFLHSLPWLIVSLGYLIWRGFLIKVPTLRSPELFTNLAASPIKTIIELCQTLVKDFVQIVVTTWYSTFDSSLFDLSIPSELFAWALAFIAFILSILFLINANKKVANPDSDSGSWNLQALILGFLAVVMGAAPAWASGRSVSAETGIWNDRFGIASMFGASLFLVGLIYSLIKPTRNRTLIILAVLIALATGSNIRKINEYRWSATYQTRFYNQLVWRAPSIKPNTSILASKELFPKMGVYPTSFALNLLYPSSNPMPKVDYWFYTISHYFPNNYHDLDQGIDIVLEKWYVDYSSVSTDSLVIYWDYQQPSCMWVLDQNDRYNPFIADDVKQTLGASNLSRITQGETLGYPPENIFGAEMGHGWCYYFEKADLAKQLKQWDQIPLLYAETVEKGYNTNSGPELTPFIFGFAMTGDFEKAVELTEISKTMAEKMNPYLCDQWTAIYNLADPSPDLTEAYQNEMVDLACGI